MQELVAELRAACIAGLSTARGRWFRLAGDDWLAATGHPAAGRLGELGRRPSPRHPGHEAAHIVRGDFAVWLVAHLGVALHCYNPLVHWIAGRLRLEQEMAADLCGAQLAGGRQRDLTLLAEMALREPRPALSWAARPFLSNSGTVIRRIEMLQRKTTAPAGFSKARRVAIAAIVIVAVCVVAGLRAPVGAAPPADAKADGNQSPAARPFDLDYVTDDTQMVVAPPGGTGQRQGLGLAESVPRQAGRVQRRRLAAGRDRRLPIHPQRQGRGDPEWGMQPWPLMVIRGKRPFDWSKLTKSLVGDAEEAEANGQTYYRASPSSTRFRPIGGPTTGPSC